jgi:hypothetical protein
MAQSSRFVYEHFYSIILCQKSQENKGPKGNGSRILRSSLGGYGLTAAFLSAYMKKCKLFTKKAQENRRDHLVQ